MTEKKLFTEEEAKEAVQCIIRSVKVTLAVCDVEYPGSKEVLLDALIHELKEMREPCRAKATTEGCERHCEDAPRKNMTFGNALDALKAGHCVAREGWNGKHQFVQLATCISYKGAAGEIVICHHNAIGNNALAFIGTSGVQMGWLASQADMLAEDWYIVE